MAIARARSESEPVQYYLAVLGTPGADLALLAARAAILAHRRFRRHPGYAKWRNGSQAKVVLRAEPAEIAALARAHDGLAVPEPPDAPLLAVFRPRAKGQAAFLAHLKLYSGRLAQSVRAEWPESGLHAPILVNADLDVSAGKLAAQVAHAALALQEASGELPTWRDWLAAGMPLALLLVPGRRLAELVEAGRAYGVEDEGRTEVPAGSVVAAAGPPGQLARWRAEPDLALLAAVAGRPVEP